MVKRKQIVQRWSFEDSFRLLIRQTRNLDLDPNLPADHPFWSGHGQCTHYEMFDANGESYFVPDPVRFWRESLPADLKVHYLSSREKFFYLDEIFIEAIRNS